MIELPNLSRSANPRNASPSVAFRFFLRLFIFRRRDRPEKNFSRPFAQPPSPSLLKTDFFPNFPFLFPSKAKSFFVLASAFCLFGAFVSAQTNFIQVERGDVREFDEFPIFTPDVRVSGEFDYALTMRRGSFLQNPEDGEGEDRDWMDFRLHFRSEVDRNVSLNLSLTNTVYRVGRSRNSRYSTNRKERENTPEVSRFRDTPIFDVAHVDYEFTPNSHLLVGLQKIAPGDRMGLVYRGNHSGILLDCGLGTWCLNFGYFRVSDNDTAFLRWIQILYPVFEDGVTKKNLWNPEEPLRRVFFDVDFYQIHHQDFDIPLARFGGRTWDASADAPARTNPFQVLDEGLAVYYDASNVYRGVNLDWGYREWGGSLNYVNLDGERSYARYDGGNRVAELGERQSNGTLFNLDFNYTHADRYRYGASYFQSSGNGTRDSSADEVRRWTYDQSAYYSIEKGTFGDALIYFDGYRGLGEAHSVSNLNYWRAYFSFRTLDSVYGFDLSYYALSRTKPVRNDADEEVSDIGGELDLGFSYFLEKGLVIRADASVFQPKEAYAANDNLVPSSTTPKDFSMVRLSFSYRFE